MLGTTHVDSMVDCIGTSNKYIKVEALKNEGAEWKRRESVLGRLLDYDSKYQQSINDPTQLLQLTETEVQIRDYFAIHQWMVFRGDPKFQRQRPLHLEPKCER